MQLLKEAMETIKGDNQKLRRALQASEDRASTLQKQLAGRMMTDKTAIQQASGLAQILAGRQEKLRVVIWIATHLAQETAYAHARYCLSVWSRHALLQRQGRHKPESADKESPVVDQSSAILLQEDHLKRCRSLANWSARRQSLLIGEQAALKCLSAWRKCAFARSRERMAQWAAKELERQANHGLLLYCFFSYRRFVKGQRRPGTLLNEEDAPPDGSHREELSLLTPAALCKAAFHQNASRRLRCATIWSAWRSAAYDLRQDRVAVALHHRFEQEHDLMDQRIVFFRDVVVKEKLRNQATLLLRWTFDALMRCIVMGRHKARSQRKEEELQSMFTDAKRTMDHVSNRTIAILERRCQDPRPWTLKLLLHLWVLHTENSKEQFQKQAVQHRLDEALAEVAVISRRFGVPKVQAKEESITPLEEFEAAGRAALSIYGQRRQPGNDPSPWASSSVYASSDGPSLPNNKDFASTAYLQKAKEPGPLEAPASMSIGTNSALWAQLDELDGHMANMSGRI